MGYSAKWYDRIVKDTELCQIRHLRPEQMEDVRLYGIALYLIEIRYVVTSWNDIFLRFMSVFEECTGHIW